MSSKYWIKLYHEVLDDPKMGMLPDNLWRRTIELFLLAGELSIDLPEDDRGNLPPTNELAWRLRRSPVELEQELEQLAKINIVTKTESGWIVTKFAERQKAVPASERMRQLRERKQKDKKPVTTDKDLVTRSVTKRNTESESDKEIDSIPNGIGDKSPSEPETPLKQLMGVFLQTTRLKMPKKKPDQGFWWSNIREIYNIVDEDIGRGKDIIVGGVNKLRADGLTIGGPESIVKTCRALASGQSLQNGATNGHNRQHDRPLQRTGEALEGEPTFDPGTKELVFPDGHRIPAVS